MSTTTDEIAIDIDAIDAKLAEEATKKAKNDTHDANSADPNAITVEKTDSRTAQTANKVVSPEEGLEKLKKQLEDEKMARQAAEARANEAAQAEARARGDVQTTQLDLVKGVIEQVTQANDALEAKYADALAGQDWGGAAKAQREMANNAAKLAQLEAGKTALEKAPKPVPRTPADPIEQFCAQLSGPSAAWVRSHPEFVRDGHKNRQMIAAHEIAIARGNKADTPEYFQSIEKTLDLTPAVVHSDTVSEDDDPMAAAAKPINGARSTAPAAAPVSRGGNGTGSRPGVMKLTAAEVEMAGNMGMTPEEYARNKIALKKEGKLS